MGAERVSERAGKVTALMELRWPSKELGGSQRKLGRPQKKAGRASEGVERALKKGSRGKGVEEGRGGELKGRVGPDNKRHYNDITVHEIDICPVSRKQPQG